MTVSTYVDVSATANFSSATNGTLAVTTTGANEVLVLEIGAEQSNALAPSGISVSSVTDTAGLTWAKRSGVAFLDGRQYDTEVWWAPKPAAGATTITVTFNVSIDDACLSVCAFKGLANPSSPWTSDVSCPALSHTTTSATPSGTISTGTDVPLALAFSGGFSRPVAVGYTLIIQAQNTGGVASERSAMCGLDYGSPLSSQAVTSSTAVTDTAWIVDALVISSAAPHTQKIRSFGTVIS